MNQNQKTVEGEQTEPKEADGDASNESESVNEVEKFIQETAEKEKKEQEDILNKDEDMVKNINR